MQKLLTPQQVAELLEVKPSTIYQWTHQGFIPHVKIGRMVRYRKETIIKFLADNERTSTSDPAPSPASRPQRKRLTNAKAKA